jgi:hypothetical protein
VVPKTRRIPADPRTRFRGTKSRAGVSVVTSNCPARASRGLGCPPGGGTARAHAPAVSVGAGGGGPVLAGSRYARPRASTVSLLAIFEHV